MQKFPQQFEPVESILLGYDNACQLSKFFANQRKRFPHSPTAMLVDKIQKIHDRLHLKNHHESCRKGTLDPDVHVSMKGVNTECAEQFFSHLLRFVFTFKNSSMLRAPF